MTRLFLVTFLFVSLSVFGQPNPAGGPFPLAGGGAGGIVAQRVTSALILTNTTLFSPYSVYSNGVDQVAGAVYPMLQPYGGGVYSGLRITNSATLSATKEIAGMGFPLNSTYPVGTYYWEFRDCVFWDGTVGGNGDGVSWQFGATATNYVYFYDCIFHAPKYAFNLVQQIGAVGYFEFKSCDFEAIGPGTTTGAGSISVAFAPDQGPVTNILEGCRFTTKGSSLGVGVLDQVQAFTWLNDCHFNVVSTNANSENMALAFSGEGNTVLVLNNCYFHLGGPGTNSIMDINIPGTFGAGANCALVLNNCFYDGVNNASGGWLLDTRAAGSGFTVTVAGGNLTWTNFATLTNVTFINPPPMVIRTNFVSGQLYTNVYGTPIEVSTTITNVEAAVTGTTRFDVWVFQQGGAASIAGTTNFCGNQTLGTSLATTNMWHLAARVPAGFVWTFTNQCVGTGNAAGPRATSGQIAIP